MSAPGFKSLIPRLRKRHNRNPRPEPLSQRLKDIPNGEQSRVLMCTPDNTEASELIEKVMRTAITDPRIKNAIIIRLYAVETEDLYIYQHTREADPNALSELTVARKTGRSSRNRG